jgi:hypothetical protein
LEVSTAISKLRSDRRKRKPPPMPKALLPRSGS